MEETSLYFGIGLRLALGVLGILLYAGWKVREHLANFSFSILWTKNKPFWLWSISMIIILLTVVTISPEAATAIKTMIGLDITNEPTSFLSLGWALAMISNGAVKKKIDQKN